MALNLILRLQSSLNNYIILDLKIKMSVRCHNIRFYFYLFYIFLQAFNCLIYIFILFLFFPYYNIVPGNFLTTSKVSKTAFSFLIPTAY